MQDILTGAVITFFLGYLVTINVLTFLLYAVDKRRSIKKQWRISESTLLLFTIALGGIGSFCAMRFLRHKTQKFIFKATTAISLILIIVVAGFTLI